MRVRSYRRRKRAKVRLLFFFILLLACVFWTNGRIHPVAKSMAANQAEIISTRVINEAVTDVLSEQGVQYEELMRVERDGSGRVEFIEINAIKVNALKAAVSTAIQDRMLQFESTTIGIPSGNLLGGDFFIGRGPRIPITLRLSGSIVTEMVSEFDDAGINQTRHCIYLKIASHIYAMIPGATETTETQSNFLIAETVIAGAVPDSYTHVSGDEAPTISKINDYSQD